MSVAVDQSCYVEEIARTGSPHKASILSAARSSG
jgi:hypothetical protein